LNRHFKVGFPRVNQRSQTTSLIGLSVAKLCLATQIVYKKVYSTQNYMVTILHKYLRLQIISIVSYSLHLVAPISLCHLKHNLTTNPHKCGEKRLFLLRHAHLVPQFQEGGTSWEYQYIIFYFINLNQGLNLWTLVFHKGKVWSY
jgi:hypothetical protein